MRNLLSKGSIPAIVHFFYEFNTFFYSGFSSRNCISCVFHCDGPLFIYFFFGWVYVNEIYIFVIYISKPIFLYTRSVYVMDASKLLC